MKRAFLSFLMLLPVALLAGDKGWLQGSLEQAQAAAKSDAPAAERVELQLLLENVAVSPNIRLTELDRALALAGDDSLLQARVKIRMSSRMVSQADHVRAEQLLDPRYQSTKCLC